jgi:hypothetical protein
VVVLNHILRLKANLIDRLILAFSLLILFSASPSTGKAEVPLWAEILGRLPIQNRDALPETRRILS